MFKNYFKRGALMLGAAAVAASAYAGGYVDVSRHYMKDLNYYMGGWQGYIGNTAEGVGEVFGGAFDCYQYIDDLPAGEYTLSANAFYRCGTNEYAMVHQKGNADLNTCYIYAGDAKTTVKCVYEHSTEWPAENTPWDVEKNFPNGMSEARAAFDANKFNNTVTFTHNGGTLRIGICNTGCYLHEWTCFSDFKLVGADNTDYSEKIINRDFKDCSPINDNDKMVARGAWASTLKKCPDVQKDETQGGNFRKCGGSPYIYGQKVTLPEGKYRWGMKTFHRYGSVEAKDGKYYNHKSGVETDPFGTSNRKGSDWYKANDYDTYNTKEEVLDAEQTYAHAYIFVTYAEACPANLYLKPDDDDFSEGTPGLQAERGDLRVRIKDAWEICNGDYDAMPKGSPAGILKNENDGNYEVKNTSYEFHDSSHERESAAAFLHEGDKYFQYVEFTVPAGGATLWLGMGKAKNTGDGYWQPWCDQKLLAWDENASSGVDSIALDTEIDENAPVEYFNMQGVRVAEPTTGLYIVRQGNKVSKQLIRK